MSSGPLLSRMTYAGCFFLAPANSNLEGAALLRSDEVENGLTTRILPSRGLALAYASGCSGVIAGSFLFADLRMATFLP